MDRVELKPRNDVPSIAVICWWSRDVGCIGLVCGAVDGTGPRRGEAEKWDGLVGVVWAAVKPRNGLGWWGLDCFEAEVWDGGGRFALD